MPDARITRLAVALLLATSMAHSSSTTQATAPVQRESTVAIPAREVRADDNGTDIVDAEMRHVDFHIDSGIVLRIARLRGSLSPTLAGTPPTFDDKKSFTLRMHSADIAIDTLSLAVLLNRHVFGARARCQHRRQ